MIDKFCDFIIKKIKQNVDNLDEEKELVIDFGVRLLFGETPKVILLFVIGFALGIGWYTLLMFFLLMPYRSCTGGFHLKTHLGCMITTTILYVGPVILAKYIQIPYEYLKYIFIPIIGIMSVILITKYAPADTENVPIISKKERKSKKIKAYITLVALLIVALVIKDNVIAYMLIYGIFMQSLSITPIAYKLSNCKYSFEVLTQEIV